MIRKEGEQTEIDDGNWKAIRREGHSGEERKKDEEKRTERKRAGQ